MKIGLFFGTFDPIHLGHLTIAQNALQFKLLDQVWFVLTPRNPFKVDLTISSTQHRIAMIEMALIKYRNILFSDIELKLKAPQYTSDTLRHITKKHPQHKFSIIMGSDNYCQLPKWKNSEYILNNFIIYVYARKGYSIDKLDARFQLLGEHLRIASSEIRKNIRSPYYTNMLTKEVLDYIQKNRLYCT